MNAKIKKINAEYEKNAAKIAELQARQKELDKLEAVLDKYYDGSLTPDDLLTLDISISIGTIKCVCIEEGDDAMDKLRTQYPNAR